MLAVPDSTIKAWAFGQCQGAGRAARCRAVVMPADRRRKPMSSANPCDLRVLATPARVHRISLPHVRASLDFAERELETERPLIVGEFLTNGIDRLIEHAGQLVNTSAQGRQTRRRSFEEGR
jgi:hypothetical protein